MFPSNFSLDLFHGRDRRFVPNANLEGKENWSRHVFVDVDGSIQEAIRLNVLDDRHREDIIGFHFSRQYAELHYRDQDEAPQFYVISRDCPWDFEYVLHDATTFFVEICRIADQNLLRLIKSENDCIKVLQKRLIKGFEVQKVERHFPGTLPAEIVGQVKTKADKNKVYDVGDADRVPKMFLRPPMNPRIDLKSEIEKSIQKKVKKAHSGKERTILLLDNLTTHSNPDDFFDAVDGLSDFLANVPFPSIWLYTGYYSDNDGFNCEYSLIPIKLSPVDEQALLVARDR